jgi:uncharacterized protein (TIGR03435 family)
MAGVSVRVAICLWLGASAAYGQPLTFEAATVKTAAPADPASGTLPAISRGRLEFRSVTLRTLMYYAYGTGLSTALNVSGGPDWMNRNRYTIEAVAQGAPTDRDYRAMLRSLIEERFAAKTHLETREIDVYALVPDRTDGTLGPNLKPWDGTCAGGAAPRPDGGDPTIPRCFSPQPLTAFRAPGLVLQGVTMTSVADMLSIQRRLLGRLVQDRSGLTGLYDVELTFNFPGASQPDYAGPSLFTVLKEQLGLKLEAAKGSFQVLTVDSASVPDEN